VGGLLALSRAFGDAYLKVRLLWYLAYSLFRGSSMACTWGMGCLGGMLAIWRSVLHGASMHVVRSVLHGASMHVVRSVLHGGSMHVVRYYYSY
jgi:hypothetical protein